MTGGERVGSINVATAIGHNDVAEVEALTTSGLCEVLELISNVSLVNVAEAVAEVGGK